MYASYGSEGMALNLQCDRETMYARLWRGERRERWPFSLQSGAARADLAGTSDGDSEVVVTASMPVTAPVLTAIRESGDLTLVDHDTTLIMDAAVNSERQAIDDFFAACR
jgi:hypothetical protein